MTIFKQVMPINNQWQERSDCLDCQEVIQKNSSSCRKTQNLKPEKSAAKTKSLRLNQSKRNP
jgi:hypothetical protein